MTELEGSGEQLPDAAVTPLSRSERVLQHIQARGLVIGLGIVVVFLAAVMLVLYFKPGSTVQPSGEPSLDMFGAGPVLDLGPGQITHFENEHFFLVRLTSGRLVALYDLPPATQARVQAGETEALECRAVLREDGEMAGWLAGADTPAQFADRGIWHECSGAVWDVTGEQVRGPAMGSLDRFPTLVIDGIIWVDLGARQCTNPVTPETPCIETQ